jgi:hypothetical protein
MIIREPQLTIHEKTLERDSRAKRWREIVVAEGYGQQEQELR